MNPGFLWQSALERIRQRVSPGAFSTWFRDTCGLALEGRQLTVGVANTFACEHLGQRFGDLARVALSEALGAPAHVTFVVRRPAPMERQTIQPSASSPQRQTAPADATMRPAADVDHPLPTTPSSMRQTGNRRPSRDVAHIAHSGAAAYAPHHAPTERAPLARWPRDGGVASPPANSSLVGASNGIGAQGETPRNDARWMAQPPLLRLSDEPARAQTVDDGALPTHTGKPGEPRRAPTTPRLLAASGVAQPTASAAPQHELRPTYRFDTFVVGTANRLAYAAAQEVVRAPGAVYNPLVIFGGPGLGKTHLLHAIGHSAVAAGRHVAYVTAEQFTNELIEAIQRRATEAFRRRYRAVDLLLMDDAQCIAGREATEEEFFHTFNWLHEANKQIVLTSDCPPQAMRRLNDRLRSRFAWGLIADIQSPDAGQRLDILRAKAQSQALDVADETLACLARPECASVRELEGKLTRVVAYARLLERPLDVALVAQALGPVGSTPSLAGDPSPATPYAQPVRRAVDAMATLEVVGRHFGVSMAALLGKSREHQVAWARQVAMYVLRETTDASLFQIGAQLGGRDHTTIMHGCARVGQALASDPRLRADLAAIQRALT